MRTVHFHGTLIVLFCLVGGFMVLARAQSQFPPCEKDGTPPVGRSQCECDPWVYQGEVRDVKREYQVRLPDGIVATGPCRAGGTFRISLDHPKSSQGDGDFPWSKIYVGAVQESGETLRKMVDNFATNEMENCDHIHASDLAIDQPIQTALSSLPATRLKATWTDPDWGNLIHEAIVTDSPDKSIVYEIIMLSPASRYDTDRKLLETVVEGFIPIESAEKH